MNEPQQPSNYRVSLKALIGNGEGKILLVKEDADGWGIPGGGLDHGETLEEGMRREIQEEVGVEMASMSALPLMVGPYYRADINRWRLWLLYEVTLAAEPRIGDHCSDVGWFSKSELSTIPIDTTETEGVRDIQNRFL